MQLLIRRDTLMLSWKWGEVSLSKFSDNLKYNTRLMPSPSASPGNMLAAYVGNWNKRNAIKLCRILACCSNRKTTSIKPCYRWIYQFRSIYVVWDGEWTCILTRRREGTFSCSLTEGSSRCWAMWFTFRGHANKSTPIGI